MIKNKKGLDIGTTQPLSNRNELHNSKLKRQATLIKNNRNKIKRQLNQDMLPAPRDYYAGVLKKFHPRNQQATALCPFHKDSNPSFSVDLKRGRFFCFSCGAAGGDIIDFYQRLHGINFVQAITDLGAWEYE